MLVIDEQDRFIYGAEPIGRLANLLKDDGRVDIRKTYYALKQGYIDADQFGQIWRTTPRRILSGRGPRLAE